MDKREFLKASGAFVTGSMLSRFSSAQQQEPGSRTNWAGNLTYSTDHLHSPGTVEEVRQVVKSCDKLRALGSRHSFNAIADSTANQISLKRLDTMKLDEKAHTVTVGGGVPYGVVAPWLDSRGYALHNLASLPHISVAGAIATATHGSGIHNGNLATPVSALEIVTADGQMVHLSREKDGDRFLGTVVGLGALGVVTEVSLNVLPTFQVAQSVYLNLSFDHLQHHFDEIFGSGYSVSLFTDWQNHQATQVWIKRKLTPGDANKWQPEFFGAKAATRKMHPIGDHDAEPCTEQQGIPGPWYERLPHFRMGFTPSAGNELQSEYFVPRRNAVDAILAVERLRDQVTPHLLISEIRTIAADDLWMSTCYGRPSVTIHFTWKPDWPAVRHLLPVIEKELSPFQPRPHWGKLFTLSPADFWSRYERMKEFIELATKYDPKGKFRNDFLSTYVFAR
jgi:xylitol oxidase